MYRSIQQTRNPKMPDAKGHIASDDKRSKYQRKRNFPSNVSTARSKGNCQEQWHQ